MYEKMKSKYRRLIYNKESAEILFLVDTVLTNLQSILIKNELYSEKQLIDQIYILKGVDNHLYETLFDDIKNKQLLEGNIL